MTREPSELSDDAVSGLEPAAGGGLLHRRHLLRGGALGLGGVVAASGAIAATLPDDPWMKVPGASFRGYGQPAPQEAAVQRGVRTSLAPLTVGAGSSVTPLHQLQGTITPNGLHFERHHNGVPAIDPSQHRLLIHGMVKRPLAFSVESLLRYPTAGGIWFVECAGNSAANTRPQPVQMPAGGLHGLVSCAEWTGISLAVLLDEAGVEDGASWILAEGADAAGMSRSIPLEKAMADTIVALWQNGERVRPEQGYPMRLVVPGFQGNMNVKWVRRIKVVDGPVHTKDETSKYTQLMPDGKSRQFTLPLGVKSVITHPSGGAKMHGPGLYEVSGLAWSGSGRIRSVEVSVDGGKSWAEAALQEPVLSKALSRFRIAWRYEGGPATLQSRAIDETGERQPGRDEWRAQFSVGNPYHFNAIQSWGVAEDGSIANVYA